jgi:hypothetical protein
MTLPEVKVIASEVRSEKSQKKSAIISVTIINGESAKRHLKRFSGPTVKK